MNSTVLMRATTVLALAGLVAGTGCEEPSAPAEAAAPSAAEATAAPSAAEATAAPSAAQATTAAVGAAPGSTPIRIDFSASSQGGGITATANGRPIQLPTPSSAPSHVVKQDPNGLWKYEMESDSEGMSFKFELGAPSGAAASAAGQAAAANSAYAAHQAATRKARQQLQQLQAKAAARLANGPAPAGASFKIDVNLSADFDPNQLLSQLSGAVGQQLAAAAQAHRAGGGAPAAGPAVANPSPQLPLPSLSSLAGSQPTPQQQAAFMRDFWQALASHGAAGTSTPKKAPTTATPSHTVPSAPPAAGAVAADPNPDRETVADVTELYIWLAAEQQLEEARELVTAQCHDGPVGRAEAVAFLGQSLEVLDADVEVLELDGRHAKTSWELTALLPAPVTAGEDAAPPTRRGSVNLTGEVELVRDDGEWYVTCPD